MDIRSSARNLLQIARQHNVKAAAITAWSSAMRSKRVIHLVALSEPQPSQQVLDAGREHEFRFATLDELRQLHSQPEIPLADNDLIAAANGDRCILQLDGDTLAGYAWIARSPLIYIADGVHLNLPDDTVYNYKAYTAPEYRGRGFQALRHLRLLEVLRSEGKRRLFGYVDRINHASLKGVYKSGYRKVGELVVRRRRERVVVRITVAKHFWCDDRRVCIPASTDQG